MPQQPRFRAGVVILPIVFVLTCGFLTYAQRGPSAGPARPTNQGQNRGNAPARGAAPARGQRGQRGQNEDPNPTDGLTLAWVTVTTKDHHAVPGLSAKNFKITEDNVEQNIELFTMENGPISVGFVLGAPPNESRGVPLAFLKATPWTNEFFLINDDGHPPGGTVIQSFTTDPLKATTIYPQGGVSKDSIFMGLDYLKEAANRRKLLLLIGGTLNSDASNGVGLDPFYVERVATKQDVQVYSIITSNDGSDTFDDGGGTSDIAPLTGGRSYLSQPYSTSLESTAQEIARGLGVQYEIGYRATNTALDGKWRKIRVSLVSPPESLGKLDVWTKAGYYADKVKKK